MGPSQKHLLTLLRRSIASANCYTAAWLLLESVKQKCAKRHLAKRQSNRVETSTDLTCLICLFIKKIKMYFDNATVMLRILQRIPTTSIFCRGRWYEDVTYLLLFIAAYIQKEKGRSKRKECGFNRRKRNLLL